MRTILVTGGLGFIGSNLIQLLIKKGYSVINIDKVSSNIVSKPFIFNNSIYLIRNGSIIQYN